MLWIKKFVSYYCFGVVQLYLDYLSLVIVHELVRGKRKERKKNRGLWSNSLLTLTLGSTSGKGSRGRFL